MRTEYEVEYKNLGQPNLVDDERGDEALAARLPLLSGSANKVRYLSYRAMGFTIRESAGLTDVTESTVRQWRRNDPEFRDVELKYIRDLQRNLSGDLLRIEFMRNMRLAMNRDFQVLFKASSSLEVLTEREMDYLKLIRKHYTPIEMLNLDRAIAPEYDEGASTRVAAQITVEIDGKQLEDEVSRRAASRALLEKFKVTAAIATMTDSGRPPGDFPGTTVDYPGIPEGSTNGHT